MLNLPRFKAAAVQAAPAFLDPVATVDKAASLIREAAANGAALVAFPEVFVAGYPYWSWIVDPVAGSAWFEKLVRASIMVPGPEVDQLCTVAREAGVHVVIGVNERSPVSLGTLYNTMLFIGPDGEILGKHRKLVPTWAEKLTWAHGDGSTLTVYDTAIGPLGGLACGENTNTLARFTLLAQGELVHVASYIALPVAPPDYDMAEAIRVRAAAHCFEGKLFTIVSCSTVSEEIIAAMETLVPDARARLERKNSAFSGILGPDGRTVGAPLIDEEGIVYAEIDLSRCIQPKQMHDIIGHYNRFDIFDLRVNAMPQQPVRIAAETKAEPLPALADAPSS
ncbi:carbon-nitrogen hydrolase family protein [Sphingomonas sp. S17]|uniref:Carbon-nitrogen hydrolase family protein n=2 Tax=Sphingomonas paucimobilis TaxID=13689 RepID=A0A411LL81_SPHPI|nr:MULTISPECIES: carbon-nitrogen hydrolase family protein [Sphingomonas]EGI54774.1 carbon-nitrogen hydrolase family protein [Sphingomonas sp. S17]MBQ1481747.1 carbon-nitrogen hydrolase family protein [Sphingomonas sp.]MCM3681537.1 carbon-nitrogen hydrolase family protein [Sphingomonas paucimobilis]MDG5970226.1 carbon-nitrogen hydrolase family protein [Sphingomonas paucimobilis]NNG56187.1 carbon-nitrogen hydrolase family protein [Sphingomonas paucimobilis]